LPAAPLALADHLPPGVQVIHFRTPAYVDKLGKGNYTKQDIDQAMELAKLGDAEAQANVGVMLVSQGQYKEAANWFKQAADAGIASAAYNLGTMYFNGQGFSQDYDQARTWFELGAKRNDPYAEFQLGLMYFSGKGEPQDAAKELYWYDKAARNGLPAAAYNLGVMYHNGEGVDTDDVKAYAWLLFAQRGGLDIAEAKDAVAENLTPEQTRQAEALSRTLYVEQDHSVRH
jgi:hypothetical protein